jgi:hypothetical protein
MDKISRSQDARIVAAGIDATKSTFSVCGLDGARRIALERTMNRARLLVLFVNLPPCTVGLEACSGAHQLARELIALGHTVCIIAAKFVAPHRTSGKNDRNDALAIVDALLHPRTRFVPVMSLEQQALLSLQRARHGFVCERTAWSIEFVGFWPSSASRCPSASSSCASSGRRPPRHSRSWRARCSPICTGTCGYSMSALVTMTANYECSRAKASRRSGSTRSWASDL